MGGPKALVELDGEPLVLRALRALAQGGCAPLVVVLGAAAADVRPLLPTGTTAVVAQDWTEGMSASLRAGLRALEHGAAPAAVVHLVDLPGVTAAGVARLAARAAPEALVRAAYAGRPGHPVLIGRSHWAAVLATATGDAGARAYLAGHPALDQVECGDVADPGDVDTPEELTRFRDRWVTP